MQKKERMKRIADLQNECAPCEKKECKGCPIRKELDKLIGIGEKQRPEEDEKIITWKDKPKVETKEDEEAILETYKELGSIKATSHDLGYSHKSIINVLHKYNAMQRPGKQIGLKPEQEKEAIALYLQEKSMNAVLVEFNTSKEYFKEILKKHGVKQIEGKRGRRHSGGFMSRIVPPKKEKGNKDMVQTKEKEVYVTKQEVDQAMKEIKDFVLKTEKEEVKELLDEKRYQYLIQTNAELRGKVLELEEENAALRKLLKRYLQ